VKPSVDDIAPWRPAPRLPVGEAASAARPPTRSPFRSRAHATAIVGASGSDRWRRWPRRPGARRRRAHPLGRMRWDPQLGAGGSAVVFLPHLRVGPQPRSMDYSSACAWGRSTTASGSGRIPHHHRRLPGPCGETSRRWSVALPRGRALPQPARLLRQHYDTFYLRRPPLHTDTVRARTNEPRSGYPGP